MLKLYSVDFSFFFPCFSAKSGDVDLYGDTNDYPIVSTYIIS